MKKIIVALMLVLSLGLSACSSDSDKGNTVETTDTQVTQATQATQEEETVTTEVKIEFNDRVNTEDIVVEIPTFVGNSKEIEAMNKAVADSIGVFAENSTSPEGYGVYSYPVTTENYVQVLSIYAEYGSAEFGNLLTINYDKNNDDYITLDDLFSSDSHDMGGTLEDITAQYEAKYESETVKNITILGFFIHENNDGGEVEFFVEIQADDESGETWLDVYSYKPDYSDLEYFDQELIIDPLIVDKYDPELMANKLAQEMSEYEEEEDDDDYEEEVDLTMTEGLWRLDGEEYTAFFEMDGNGYFSAYYASGSLEYGGYLEYIDVDVDYSGYTVFEMYTGEDEKINEMWFLDSETFYLGEPTVDNTFVFFKD